MPPPTLNSEEPLIVCRFARACGLHTKALRFHAVAKAAGKVRMEGKDYVMADGDVVEFRFNV